MKLLLKPLVLGLSLLIPPVSADINSDSNEVLNLAEQVYSNFFPSSQQNQTADPWIYRFYPTTKIYLGINKNEGKVYLLGGEFGDKRPTEVNTVAATLSHLKAKSSSASGAANGDFCEASALPKGFNFSQTGNDVFLSTDGCINVNSANVQNFCTIRPDRDSSGAAVETGISALISIKISSMEAGGFSLPAAIIPKTSTCLINAPKQISEITVHSDLCIIAETQTVKVVSSSTTEIIGDCFSSDAQSITNPVTKETWTKNPATNSFDKVR